MRHTSPFHGLRGLPRALARAAAGAFLLGGLGGLAGPAAWAAVHETADLHPACRSPGQAVSEARHVQIGGRPQWVTITGADCANPVVVMVHGGPGNPLSPFAQAMFGPWTGAFTLVQWDQRGAGKTYAAQPPAEDEPLTLAQIVDDGLAVTEWVTQRLGQRRVILMGGSWGSAVAVNMAVAAPERFRAYVGSSQLVSVEADTAAAYERTLALVRAAGDTVAAGKLEALGPPPWKDPRAFGVLRRISRAQEALRTEAPPAHWFRFGEGYDTSAYAAAHEAGEEYSFLNFVGLSGPGMRNEVQLHTRGLKLGMPVVLLQGEHDLVTPMPVSRAYFDALQAPKKQFIVLPRTGHDPNALMLEAQYRVLQELKAQTGAAHAP